MLQCYDSATALIPTSHQPALVLEFAHSQGLDSTEVLAGTGWSPVQVSGVSDPIWKPAQYLRMLANTQHALGGDELAFTLGRRMLPGHFGAASHALLQAPSLRRTLELLAKHASRLSPLLVPHFRVEDGMAMLVWTNACGLGQLRNFVVNMHMAALVALCHWRGGQRLPWTFCFNRTAPRNTAQLEVHLSTHLRFGCQVDALLIHSDWLDPPWLSASETDGAAASSVSARAAEQECVPRSFLGTHYAHLLAHAQCMPTLEDTAQHFGLSPATFKRRLAQEGTHYQAELDQVRSHVALRLMYFRGFDNEAVAQHLGYYDAANFRRSFKRWTGLTPSLFRDALGSFSMLSKN